MDGNYSNSDLSNENLSNGDPSTGDLSNGNFSSGDLSNGDLSNGEHSNGDHSDGELPNGSFSNGSSHSPAPQPEWKKSYEIRNNQFEKSQAELQESQLECTRLESQCRESQKIYQQLQEVWRDFGIEQEKDWRLQAVTARAFQEFQMVYEEERKQRLSTEQARKLVQVKIYEGLQLESETAQNTAGNLNPFSLHISQSPFRNTGQLSVPDHFRAHIPSHWFRQNPEAYGSNLNLSPFIRIPTRRTRGRAPAPE